MVSARAGLVVGTYAGAGIAEHQHWPACRKNGWDSHRQGACDRENSSLDEPWAGLGPVAL